MKYDFSKLKILVLGDIFLDEYMIGDCTRISPEAPVPVVVIDYTKTRSTLGGAGNVAANIASMGGNVTLAGRLGLDSDGAWLEVLLGIKMIVSLIACPKSYRTPKKTRIIANNQQVVRIDHEQKFQGGHVNEARIMKAIPEFDAIVISDYAKGYFTLGFTQRLIFNAKRAGKLVIVDPKPCNARFYVGADYLTPNQKEYSEGNFPFTNRLVTKGAEGMEYFGMNGEHFVRPTVAKEVFDVAGAGDTVVAAFALAVAAKLPIEEAVDFANKAAGVVVGKKGTSTVTQDEIESYS